MTKNEVKFSKKTEKALPKIPKKIVESLAAWVETVLEIGLDETRKIRGYKDKSLKGDRNGQRSIRLNKSWRAFYTVKKSGKVELVMVEDVNNHKY